MANSDHLRLVKRGARAVAKWRSENPTVVLDLERAVLIDANLSEMDLSGANFNEANLSKANCSSSNLSKSKLTNAILYDTDFRDASLHEADFEEATCRLAQFDRADLTSSNFLFADLAMSELSHAKLRGANMACAVLYQAWLDYTDFAGANFYSCDLSGAILEDTNFADATFCETHLSELELIYALGLDQVVHKGPSFLSVETIYNAKGALSNDFLRGCGVPDQLITFLPSLLGAMEPIQFYSCFISYSHKDEEFCKRLHSRMRDDKLRVWFAPEDVKGGKKLHEQIDHAIRIHDKLLLVLSEASMKSEWVATEISKARSREVKEGKQILFPIRLVPFEHIRDWSAFDADTGKDMAKEIREYFIPDFSDWKNHDAFEKEYAKLLSDMKSTEAMLAFPS